MINITDVKIIKTEGNFRVKGIASITIDDSFVVHDIKIIETQEELFVAMPSRRTPTGEFKDVAHPINAKAREIIQKAVLNEYEREDM